MSSFQRDQAREAMIVCPHSLRSYVKLLQRVAHVCASADGPGVSLSRLVPKIRLDSASPSVRHRNLFSQA